MITKEKVISWTVRFIPADNSDLIIELKDIIRRLERIVGELEN